jgi:hypothetical protein
MAAGCLEELLEFVLPTVVPKRRRGLAAAIYGHRVDHTVLDSDCSLSIIFLIRRISSSLGAAIQALVPASGVIPDKSKSGGTWRLSTSSGEHWLDRVLSCPLLGVLLQNSRSML